MSIRQGLYGEKKEVIYLQADATSLADLKAETVRKKTEAVQNRQKGNYRPEKNNEKKKKANIWSKENSGLIARMQRDMEVKAEEERTWQKSKSIMERKSKIYDSLKESKGRSEVSSRFSSSLIVAVTVIQTRTMDDADETKTTRPRTIASNGSNTQTLSAEPEPA